MDIQIEIDSGSGFCFGVTTAIKKAEEELAAGKTLYCLGDIVHNGMEVDRLHSHGLVTINHDDLRQLHDVKVLLRAHGEPPETYELAKRNNIEIIDATCPVVLALQRRITRMFKRQNARPITEVLKSSPAYNTQPIEAGFVALVHPDLENDIRSIDGFVSTKHYASMQPMEGEIGAIEDVRYIR